MTTAQATKEKLLHDFNEVVNDTEQLLKSVSNTGGDKAQALSASIERNLEATRERLRELEQAAVERTRAAAKSADAYVHGHPWQSVGVAATIAAVLGIVVGLLLNRR